MNSKTSITISNFRITFNFRFFLLLFMFLLSFRHFFCKDLIIVIFFKYFFIVLIRLQLIIFIYFKNKTIKKLFNYIKNYWNCLMYFFIYYFSHSLLFHFQILAVIRILQGSKKLSFNYMLWWFLSLKSNNSLGQGSSFIFEKHPQVLLCKQVKFLFIFCYSYLMWC